MALTEIQQAHVNAVFPECKAQIAEYLEKGVEVVIYLQNECGAVSYTHLTLPTSDLV